MPWSVASFRKKLGVFVTIPDLLAGYLLRLWTAIEALSWGEPKMTVFADPVEQKSAA
jgi:uncharacterized protein (DUF2126 family)